MTVDVRPLAIIVIILTTIAMLSLAIPGWGTDYYVSSSGNNDNIGTSPDNAWESFSRVNALDLRPGDRILLEAGARFAGPLLFDSEDRGTGTEPIVVTSYGGGWAAIEAGTGVGLSAHNTAGIALSKINFAGDGRIINTSDGINFYTNLPGDVKLTGIYIDEVAVTGFGHNGIRIGGWNGRSGFRDIRITHALLQDNGLNGLVTYAQSPHANELVYVGHVRSCRNSGLPTATPSSGSGIVLGGVDEGIVEWSIAHDNGWLGNAGVGIWTYASTNITIQYNESFDNRTAGHADGGGFDLDGGVTHSVLQYNYSHGNDGAGYGLFQYKEASPWFGNTVRHNMSINDGRKNDFAGIQVWNGGSSLAAAEIYDNVVVMGTSEQGIPSALSFKTGSSGFFLHHNTFIATGEARLITIAPWQEQLRVADNRCWSMVRDALQDEGLDRAWCEEYHHL